MLVLSRKLNEALVINGSIEVTVLEIRNGRVRLGIDAPKQVSIHREEVQRRVNAEQIRQQ